MKEKTMLIIVFVLFTLILIGKNRSWRYYGQTPPGNLTKLFAPEIIKHLAHNSPTLTSDGREIYWSTVSNKNETE